MWLHQIEQHMAERYDHPFDAEEVEEEDLLSSFTNTVFSIDKRMFKLKEIVADIERDMDLLVGFLAHLRGLSEVRDVKVQAGCVRLLSIPIHGQAGKRPGIG